MLAESNVFIGIGVLLRSILEGYVDLINLKNNPDYASFLEAKYLKEMLKVINVAKSGKNKYLNPLKMSDILANPQLEQLRVRNTELKSQKTNTLKIEQKFKMAGLEDMYHSHYNWLCCESHNDLRTLYSRHVDLTEDSFDIIFYKEYSENDRISLLGALAEILVKATKLTHEFFKSPVLDKISAYQNDLKQMIKS